MFGMSITANAETATDILMQDGEVTLATGTSYNFYDEGGIENEYSDNLNQTLTVNAPDGKLAQVTFSSYSIEGRGYDYLKIYDGISANENKLLATLEKQDITKAVSYTASAANGGALTFLFKSDNGTTLAGWDAELSLIDPNDCYTISYNANDGEGTMQPQWATKDTETTLTTNTFTKVGYDFTGWDTDESADDVIYTDGEAFNLNANITLYAVWTEEREIRMGTGSYTLNSEKPFYDNGGIDGDYSNGLNQTLTVNAPAGKLVRVTFTKFDVANKSDYLEIYDGTSTSATLLAKHDADFSDAITYTATNADSALTFRFYSNYSYVAAGWEATLKALDPNDYYTISYDARGGEGAMRPLLAEKSTATALDANTFTKVGYTFAGWDTDVSADEVIYTDGENINHAADITLYAVWKVSDKIIMGNGNYTLNSEMSFYDNGGKDGNYSDDLNQTLTVNAPAGKLVRVTFTKFDVYSKYDYLEIYDGTSTSDTLLAKYDASFSDTITYTATNAGGALTFHFESNAAGTAAGWEATLKALDPNDYYTISYDARGGEGAMLPLLAEKSTATALDANTFTKVGYTFAGWDTDVSADEVIYTDGENINHAADITLYAVWTVSDKIIMGNGNYTLNSEMLFYDDGGKDGDYSDELNQTLTVNAPAGKRVRVTFTKFDVYSYWDYLEIYDGTSTSDTTLLAKHNASFSDTITYTATNAGGALTFHFESNDMYDAAGWEATLSLVNIDYTITYKLNEGTNDAANPATYTVETETITLADASRDGYIFDGWYSDAEFTNEVTEITVGSTGNKELYAKFLETYTITYKLNGGTNDDNNPATYTVETETITLADASKDGFTFAGWYSDAEFTNEVTEITVGSTGNVELWAKWTEDVSTGLADATAAPFTRVQNTLYFAQPTDMAVYNVSGVMLYSGEVTEYTLPSAAGVYIIRTNAGAYKVMGN